MGSLLPEGFDRVGFAEVTTKRVQLLIDNNSTPGAMRSVPPRGSGRVSLRN